MAMVKCKIKKGDKVRVVAGDDKGKEGVVVRVLPRERKVLIEGVNLVRKHIKPRAGQKKGRTVERALPLDISNVALIDPTSGKPTRVRVERKDGKRVRVAVKSGKSLD
ncbi:MAG: 50S ribosomal protein L24 [Candidatus Parcubacteria bacterium]|nr:MAG: 50S ribosomal protein L24 [Candidatus Parcubacteria bacterium]